MVLQTTCRCLRQVDKGAYETALIWLNEDNVKTLDAQLKEEQRTSVEEVNAIGKGNGGASVPRTPRTDYLKLPPLDFYQLKIAYETVVLEEQTSPEDRLKTLLDDLKEYRSYALVEDSELTGETVTQRTRENTHIVDTLAGAVARMDFWLAEIAKESFDTLTYRELGSYHKWLDGLFLAITSESDGMRVYNDIYDQDAIRAEVRKAFCVAPQITDKRGGGPRERPAPVDFQTRPGGAESEALPRCR